MFVWADQLLLCSELNPFFSCSILRGGCLEHILNHNSILLIKTFQTEFVGMQWKPVTEDQPCLPVRFTEISRKDLDFPVFYNCLLLLFQNTSHPLTSSLFFNLGWKPVNSPVLKPDWCLYNKPIKCLLTWCVFNQEVTSWSTSVSHVEKCV